MPIIKGFNEQDGKEVKRRKYVELKLTSIAYKYCYDEIIIPILEYSSSFDEKVVGQSPWPEWNNKGIFVFDIKNYYNSYDENPELESALLIPEGTTSVTRWLGDKINNGNYSFPIKIFYNLSCYRNELINSLTKNKKREFKQFGYEILGTNNMHSDCEILNLVFDSLNVLGITNNDIKIRINNIEIYDLLCLETNIDKNERIILKEKLDYLAECKAGKHENDYSITYESILEFLKKYDMQDNVLNKWNLLLENKSGSITNEFYNTFGDKYKLYFDELLEIQKNFAVEDRKIFIDFCVIRSHEYYTGVSFEVDVNVNDKHFIEIAGGGRFDRLVSNFIDDSKKITVPCTGFAFGTERVIEMLEELKLLENMDKISIDFNGNSELKYPSDNSISSYFNLKNELKNQNVINIFVGECNKRNE